MPPCLLKRRGEVNSPVRAPVGEPGVARAVRGRVRFADHHVLVAVGVDEKGQKHVLGLAEGASEHQEVAKALLEDPVGRGLKTDRKYLFVIEGSKALRAALEAVFSSHPPVQRCRNHSPRSESQPPSCLAKTLPIEYL